VHPALTAIDGIPVFASLRQIPAPLDVVTIYLGSANQARVSEAIIQSRPRRVIFNPGAENPALAERLQANAIEWMNACTLVLLRTGQFDF
jgi:predicted CoA-binding protein